ncbi:MAG TPA: hypothetical protein VMA35_10470, partial [Candidatus Sulfopaludibacter sp.]|nr:hypothetical protein [Candidatus Sulfopaludibacter sp.]
DFVWLVLLFGFGVIDNFKMRATFKSFWVRKLIGKLGVPYNRRLRVRGSPHPIRLCNRFTTTSNRKQRFTRPFGLRQAGAFNGTVNQFALVLSQSNRYSGRFSPCFGHFWPSNAIFHKIFDVLLK